MILQRHSSNLIYNINNNTLFHQTQIDLIIYM